MTMIEQTSILTTDSMNKVNEEINKKLNLAHKNKEKFHKQMEDFQNRIKEDSYDNFKDKLEELLDVSFNASGLISLLVLIKSELDKQMRTYNSLALSSRITNAIKLLSEDITAYRSISYSLGTEINSLKELIAIKFPNQRYSILQ